MRRGYLAALHEQIRQTSCANAPIEDEGLGLLDPMPYRLTVNGVPRARGTLQEIEAAVATIATTRLSIGPVETLAPEVQALRGAFREGGVAADLDREGQWTFTLDGKSDNPLSMRVAPEEE